MGSISLTQVALVNVLHEPAEGEHGEEGAVELVHEPALLWCLVVKVAEMGQLVISCQSRSDLRIPDKGDELLPRSELPGALLERSVVAMSVRHDGRDG